MGQYLTIIYDYLTIVDVCNTTIDGPATVASVGSRHRLLLRRLGNIDVEFPEIVPGCFQKCVEV